MPRIFGVFLSLLMIHVPVAVTAEADGPDFFRVVGVASDDVLNIRAEPSASSAKVGAIAYDGDGIQNRGCQGGLSYSEWQAASAEEREAAVLRRWCQISYLGVEGWVAGRFLGEGNAPTTAAANPSFDCTKANSDAEDAICSDPRLAALDVELARLYRLAADGPNMTAERLKELKATQRGWIKGRNDCWKSDLGLSECVAANYALRIDELRTGYYDARQDDEAGISDGPYPYICDGLNAIVSLVSVAADPSLLSLRWLDFWITPVAVPSGSGAKFEAQTLDGLFVFWTKGDEAVFSRPDGSDLACKRDDVG